MQDWQFEQMMEQLRAVETVLQNIMTYLQRIDNRLADRR